MDLEDLAHLDQVALQPVPGAELVDRGAVGLGDLAEGVAAHHLVLHHLGPAEAGGEDQQGREARPHAPSVASRARRTWGSRVPHSGPAGVRVTVTKFFVANTVRTPSSSKRASAKA